MDNDRRFALYEYKGDGKRSIGEYPSKKKARKAMRKAMISLMESEFECDPEDIAEIGDKLRGYGRIRSGDPYDVGKTGGWVETIASGRTEWRIMAISEDGDGKPIARPVVDAERVGKAVEDAARRFGLFVADPYIKLKTLSRRDFGRIAGKFPDGCGDKKLDKAIWKYIEGIDGDRVAKAVAKAYSAYVDSWIKDRLDAGQALALGNEFETRSELYISMTFGEYIIERACGGSRPMSLRTFIDSGKAAEALEKAKAPGKRNSG